MSQNPHHQRRRTAQIPATGTHYIHDRLPRLFTGHSPAANRYSDGSAPEESHSSDDEDNENENENDQVHPQRHSTGSSFLAAAARTYSRAMYAHTTSQLSSPQEARNLPNYNRNMHAFTLNQLNHMDNTGSHNPANLKKRDDQQQQQQHERSQQMQKTQPITIVPSPTSMHKSHLPTASPPDLKLPPSTLKQLSLDEEPCGPSNTPVVPAPISMPMSSTPAAANPLVQARELEARFDELMAGVNVDGQLCGGLESEVRDFAAVGSV